LNYGDNLRSYIVFCGIMEIKKISKALSMAAAKYETSNNDNSGENYTSELATLGDTFLCSSSKKSRNMSFGFDFATKKISNTDYLVEGKLAVETMLDIGFKYNLKLPVVELVLLCINSNTDNLKTVLDNGLRKFIHSC